jgi:hypothetical protein
MKSTAKSLSLLTMLLVGYGCNEKISPELQNGNSTTLPPTIVPTEYYFRLTNTNPTVLNYVLHRTGANNQTAECSVTSNIALSNDMYRADVSANTFDNRTTDIACFMEAEELALAFNGLRYQIEASENTCEYISYSPYSYFDAIPGTTNPSWAGIICETPVGTADFLADAGSVNYAIQIGAHNDPAVIPTSPIPCNRMVDTNLPAGSRTPFPIPANFQSMCKFDYTLNGGGTSGNGMNCDSGVQNIKLMRVYNTATAPAPTDADFDPVADARHGCGGSTAACVYGAIRAETKLDGKINGSTITPLSVNSVAAKEYVLPDHFDSRSTQNDIVNYRRGLASLHLDYKDYYTSNSYWGNTTYRTTFEPSLMEKYAANFHPNGTPILASATVDAYGVATHGYTASPLAAEPFLGVKGNKINPFYTFLCLDRAFDVKARIRMIVRDWDRVFPSNTISMTYITDVFEPIASRRQDLPDAEEENAGDLGDWNNFNDRDDWDVQIPMRRWRQNDVLFPHPQGVYTNASGIVWEPDYDLLGLSYPWFQPQFFPNAGAP